MNERMEMHIDYNLERIIFDSPKKKKLNNRHKIRLEVPISVQLNVTEHGLKYLMEIGFFRFVILRLLKIKLSKQMRQYSVISMRSAHAHVHVHAHDH